MKRLALAILALALPMSGAAAQDHANWPQQPIQLLVPFPAGTTTDLVARIIGDSLSRSLGQPVIVENRPGGSGAIAMAAVANADADGYVIGLGTTTTQTVAVSMNPNLPYDPVADFEPIAMVGGVPYVMVVSGTLTEVRTLEDLLNKAKADPGSVTYGSVGEASLANLATQLFASEAGVELTHIPYSAAGQAALDNVAGRIDMQMSTFGSLQSFINEKQLTPVAVSSRNRMEQLPDVPTVMESGVPQYEATLWFAVFGPDGIPESIVTKLNTAINEAMGQPEVRSALLAQGVEPDAGSPLDLSARVEADIAKWRGVVERAGIRPQ